MGSEESKPSLPSCAILHFQPSTEVTGSSVITFDNILLLIRSISSAIPVLQMVPLVAIPEGLLAAKVAGDKLLLFVGNCSSLMKLFVQAKISAAKAESAISLFKAEVLAIENRRIRMVNANISIDDRKFEVVPALHSCEKILEFFADQSHCFWSLAIPSSEYLLSFTALYLECLCHALYLIPSYREDVLRALDKICDVLKLYQTECVEERLRQTYCHVNPGGPRPESDAEIVELIRKMKNQESISNNPNYRTSLGDKWPSKSTSSGLTSWDVFVAGFRRREGNLIFTMECFLQYRRATRELYASKFDIVINLSREMRAASKKV